MADTRRASLEEAHEILDQLVATAQSGQIVELVRGNTVVARIVPPSTRVGLGRGTALIRGDLLEPLGEAWDVEAP